jgi:hypothetical protein
MVSKGSTSVLNPLVRVEEEPDLRLTSFHCSSECLAHQGGVRRQRHPTHQTTGNQVQYAREVCPTSSLEHIGNNSAPDSIPRGRMEGSIELMGSRLGFFLRKPEFQIPWCLLFDWQAQKAYRPATDSRQTPSPSSLSPGAWAVSMYGVRVHPQLKTCCGRTGRFSQAW